MARRRAGLLTGLGLLLVWELAAAALQASGTPLARCAVTGANTSRPRKLRAGLGAHSSRLPTSYASRAPPAT